MTDSLSFVLAFVTTVVLLRLLGPLAGRIGLVDQPTSRKAHDGAVPLVGGLAMFWGFSLAALTLDAGLTPYRSFFAACAILVLVGVLDDFRELSSPARFAAQILASLLMVYWGRTVLLDLGYIGGGGGLADLGLWAVPMTVFSAVGVINALNMSDGLDGLAGALVLVPVLGLAYVAAGAGDLASAHLLGLLGLVVAGFLLFNARLPGRARALCFMGDAGSMFLGFAITWFFISLSQGPERAMAPVTALWLLVVPLFDTVWLIIHRVSNRRSPFDSDSEHLHHLLRMAGFSVNQTVGIIFGIAAAGAGVGLAAHDLGVAQATMFFTFLGLFAAYCLLVGHAWRSGRLFGWRLDRRLASRERRQGRDRRRGERRRHPDRRFGRDRRDDTVPLAESGETAPATPVLGERGS